MNKTICCVDLLSSHYATTSTESEVAIKKFALSSEILTQRIAELCHSKAIFVPALFVANLILVICCPLSFINPCG